MSKKKLSFHSIPEEVVVFSIFPFYEYSTFNHLISLLSKLSQQVQHPEDEEDDSNEEDYQQENSSKINNNKNSNNNNSPPRLKKKKSPSKKTKKLLRNFLNKKKFPEKKLDLCLYGYFTYGESSKKKKDQNEEKKHFLIPNERKIYFLFRSVYLQEDYLMTEYYLNKYKSIGKTIYKTTRKIKKLLNFPIINAKYKKKRKGMTYQRLLLIDYRNGVENLRISAESDFFSDSMDIKPFENKKGLVNVSRENVLERVISIINDSISIKKFEVENMGNSFSKAFWKNIHLKNLKECKLIGIEDGELEDDGEDDIPKLISEWSCNSFKRIQRVSLIDCHFSTNFFLTFQNTINPFDLLIHDHVSISEDIMKDSWKKYSKSLKNVGFLSLKNFHFDFEFLLEYDKGFFERKKNVGEENHLEDHFGYNLKKIDFENVRVKNGDKKWKFIITPRLEELKFNLFYGISRNFFFENELDKIKKLTLVKMGVDMEGFCEIFESVEILNLVNCEFNADEYFLCSGNFKNEKICNKMKKLRIENCYFEDKTYELEEEKNNRFCFPFFSLEELTMINCEEFQGTLFELSSFHKLKFLSIIHIKDFKFNRKWKKLLSLKNLEISLCENLDDELFCNGEYYIPNLESLTLRSMDKIFGEGWFFFRNLQEINLIDKRNFSDNQILKNNYNDTDYYAISKPISKLEKQNNNLISFILLTQLNLKKVKVKRGKTYYSHDHVLFPFPIVPEYLPYDLHRGGMVERNMKYKVIKTYVPCEEDKDNEIIIAEGDFVNILYESGQWYFVHRIRNEENKKEIIEQLDLVSEVGIDLSTKNEEKEINYIDLFLKGENINEEIITKALEDESSFGFIPKFCLHHNIDVVNDEDLDRQFRASKKVVLKNMRERKDVIRKLRIGKMIYGFEPVEMILEFSEKVLLNMKRGDKILPIRIIGDWLLGRVIEDDKFPELEDEILFGNSDNLIKKEGLMGKVGFVPRDFFVEIDTKLKNAFENELIFNKILEIEKRNFFIKLNEEKMDDNDDDEDDDTIDDSIEELKKDDLENSLKLLPFFLDLNADDEVKDEKTKIILEESKRREEFEREEKLIIEKFVSEDTSSIRTFNVKEIKFVNFPSCLKVINFLTSINVLSIKGYMEYVHSFEIPERIRILRLDSTGISDDFFIKNNFCNLEVLNIKNEDMLSGFSYYGRVWNEMPKIIIVLFKNCDNFKYSEFFYKGIFSKKAIVSIESDEGFEFHIRMSEWYDD